MTHHTLQASTWELPITAGMVLKLEAQSSTTDAEVTGVAVTRWSIYGYDETAVDIAGDLFSVPPLLVPTDGV